MIIGPFRVVHKGEGRTLVDSDGFIIARSIDSAELGQLLSAAAEMRDALLEVEHSVQIGHFDRQCPACGFTEFPSQAHAEECAIDQALDEAGLATREKRDAARREIAERKAGR